jgi:hypothetical protein
MEKIAQVLLFILGTGAFAQARQQPERRLAAGISCAEKIAAGSAYKCATLLPHNHSP